MPTAVRKGRREGLHHRSEHRMLELMDEEVTAASRGGGVVGEQSLPIRKRCCPDLRELSIRSLAEPC